MKLLQDSVIVFSTNIILFKQFIKHLQYSVYSTIYLVLAHETISFLIHSVTLTQVLL